MRKSFSVTISLDSSADATELAPSCLGFMTSLVTLFQSSTRPSPLFKILILLSPTVFSSVYIFTFGDSIQITSLITRPDLTIELQIIVFNYIFRMSAYCLLDISNIMWFVWGSPPPFFHLFCCAYKLSWKTLILAIGAKVGKERKGKVLKLRH